MKSGVWKGLLSKFKPNSSKGWLVFLGSMGVASIVCQALRTITTSDVHVPLIFVLAVLIVSLLTDGYFFGTLTALTSVITVNYAFTYPYAEMNFTIYGYPLTFLTMLAVGCAVSTLTSKLKEQERIRMESDREKLRANLLRAVSHDLRTPLTSISGSISAVLDTPDCVQNQQARSLLEDARKDADWLCRMVENLLSVTRIGDGEVQKLNKQEELLEEVLGEAVVSFRKRSPHTKLLVDLPEDILFVPMDAMLIEQVLRNLMDNAVVHGVTTKCIHIAAQVQNRFVEISVEDDGKGIDSQMLQQIFDGGGENGQQGDNTRGMGIGLMVCKTIVEAHGGQIHVRNKKRGNGAVFTFTLPLEGDGHAH